MCVDLFDLSARTTNERTTVTDADRFNLLSIWAEPDWLFCSISLRLPFRAHRGRSRHCEFSEGQSSLTCVTRCYLFFPIKHSWPTLLVGFPWLPFLGSGCWIATAVSRSRVFRTAVLTFAPFYQHWPVSWCTHWCLIFLYHHSFHCDVITLSGPSPHSQFSAHHFEFMCILIHVRTRTRPSEPEWSYQDVTKLYTTREDDSRPIWWKIGEVYNIIQWWNAMDHSFPRTMVPEGIKYCHIILHKAI